MPTGGIVGASMYCDSIGKSVELDKRCDAETKVGRYKSYTAEKSFYLGNECPYYKPTQVDRVRNPRRAG